MPNPNVFPFYDNEYPHEFDSVVDLGEPDFMDVIGAVNNDPVEEFDFDLDLLDDDDDVDGMPQIIGWDFLAGPLAITLATSVQVDFGPTSIQEFGAQKRK